MAELTVRPQPGASLGALDVSAHIFLPTPRFTFFLNKLITLGVLTAPTLNPEDSFISIIDRKD